MKYLRPLITLCALYGGLGLFLSLTNPQELAIGWLFLPFFGIWGCLYLTFVYSARYLLRRPKSRRLRLAAIAVASVPTLLLVLSSISQLTARDVVLWILLLTIGLFYGERMTRQTWPES